MGRKEDRNIRKKKKERRQKYQKETNRQKESNCICIHKHLWKTHIEWNEANRRIKKGTKSIKCEQNVWKGLQNKQEIQRQTEKQSSGRKTTRLLSFSFTDREMIFWQEHYYWDDATDTREIWEFEILLSLTFFSFKVWPGQISFTDMCLLNFVNSINNWNNNCFKMMMMSALIFIVFAIILELHCKPNLNFISIAENILRFRAVMLLFEAKPKFWSSCLTKITALGLRFIIPKHRHVQWYINK